MDMKKRTLTETQTVYAMCHVYSGPFLLPRIVTLEEIDGKHTAETTIEIKKDNRYLQWHLPAYPGVISAELTQQLGFLIITQSLGVHGLPFMIGLQVKSRIPIKAGDTITAKTILTDIKRSKFYYFEAIVLNEDGKTVMNTAFHGTHATQQ